MNKEKCEWLDNDGYCWCYMPDSKLKCNFINSQKQCIDFWNKGNKDVSRICSTSKRHNIISTDTAI